MLAGAALAVASGVTALVLEPPPPGIPVPGPLVDHGLAAARALLHASAAAAVGFALCPLLLPADEGVFAGPLPKRSLGVSAASALLLALCAGVCVLLGAVEFSPGPALSPDVVGGYLGLSRTGQALAATVLLALTAASVALVSRRHDRPPYELCLLMSAMPLLPLTLTGHGESSALHGLMMLSRGGHVLAAALWAGGLLAVGTLLTRRGELLASALPRFSRVATWSVLAVAATGILDAVIVLLTVPETLHARTLLSPYVLICAAKLCCVGVLLLLASVIRWRLMPLIREGRRTALAAWATTELGVLGGAFGLASVLSRTPVAG